MQSQHTRELISAWKLSNTTTTKTWVAYGNSPGMQVNYIKLHQRYILKHSGLCYCLCVAYVLIQWLYKTEIFAKTKSCMKPNNMTERYRVSFEKCGGHLASTQNSCVTKRANTQPTQIYIPSLWTDTALLHSCLISYMYPCHSHYFIHVLMSQPLFHICTHVTAIILYIYSCHSHYCIHVLM